MDIFHTIFVQLPSKNQNLNFHLTETEIDWAGEIIPSVRQDGGGEVQ